MALAELIRLVELTRQKVQNYRDILSQSKELTKYALIDPTLRALGWDTANPDLVRPDFSLGKVSVDYALLYKNKPLIFMKARPFGQSLEQGITQGINNCLQSSARYFFITDGLKWRIYLAHAPVPLKQKCIANFDLANGDIKNTVANYLYLHNPDASYDSIMRPI